MDPASWTKYAFTATTLKLAFVGLPRPSSPCMSPCLDRWANLSVTYAMWSRQLLAMRVSIRCANTFLLWYLVSHVRLSLLQKFPALYKPGTSNSATLGTWEERRCADLFWFPEEPFRTVEKLFMYGVSFPSIRVVQPKFLLLRECSCMEGSSSEQCYSFGGRQQGLPIQILVMQIGRPSALIF